ncbi:hypothetical protein PCAR4_570138 [Paraburkholderia caribensis]|nr:hypothetical protein PCAR4_570138 [Paraburkholderia caribensis]
MTIGFVESGAGHLKNLYQLFGMTDEVEQEYRAKTVCTIPRKQISN